LNKFTANSLICLFGTVMNFGYANLSIILGLRLFQP
jgi:hypothetical protein